MKKLLFIMLATVAFACGDQSRSNNNEAGTTEQGSEQNTENETMQPDTTNAERDTTMYDGQPDSRTDQ